MPADIRSSANVSRDEGPKQGASRGETVEVKVPDIGDFDKVAVIEVLVSPGDKVEKETSLITLESDKATMEVPSPLAGVVTEVMVAVNDQVSEGTPILKLETQQSGQASPHPEAAPPSDTPPPKPADKDQRAGTETPAAEKPRETAKEIERRPPAAALEASTPVPSETPPHASPGVRRFARELGVDLRAVTASGPKGRLLKEDVQAYVKSALGRSAINVGGFNLPTRPQIDYADFGEIEHRPLRRIQRIAGPNLHRNWLSIPHVTQFDEADITDLEQFRKQQQAIAAEQGFRLTLTALLIKASVAALKRFPQVNASLTANGDTLVIKKYYHIGVAVDTDQGLVVPVLRDADKKGLFDIARELGEVSSRARKQQLAKQDMQGGSFTISSLGGLGGTGFTPIINGPEVAILGVSRAQLRPIYRDGEFVPRLILPFSLSYDHRVVDGADAVRFTSELSALLGDLRRILL